eukprot:12410205-Karenia_brevis.AAC.2
MDVPLGSPKLAGTVLPMELRRTPDIPTPTPHAGAIYSSSDGAWGKPRGKPGTQADHSRPGAIYHFAHCVANRAWDNALASLQAATSDAFVSRPRPSFAALPRKINRACP